MSENGVEKIICPKCGHVITRRRETLIDSSEAKAREALIHGDLFFVTCPECGWSEERPYSLVYHDGRHDVSIAYANDAKAQEEFEKEAGQNDGGIFRITTEPVDLFEKAMIFHEGYDDRVIELVKEMMWFACRDVHPEYDGFFFNIGTFQDGHTGPAMVPYSNGEVLNEPIPVDPRILQMIEQEYGDIADTYSHDPAYVDEDWAAGFIDFIEDLEGTDEEEEELILMEHPEKDDVDAFLEKFYDLMPRSDERAAAFFKRNFAHIWKLIRNHADYDDSGRILFEDDRDPYSTYLPDWFDDADAVLFNAGEHAARKKFNELLLRETNTDEPLYYHNLRRAVFESIRETEGNRKALSYLRAWKKEEPDSAYIAGTEIDYYLGRHNMKKAEAMADACLHMPLKESGDDWLLEACQNVYEELGRKDKIEEVEKVREAHDKSNDIPF